MIKDQIDIDRLLRVIEGAAHATVLRYRDQDVSGDKLRALIFQYARVLRDMDIGRGKLLAMIAPNRTEALAMRYAAHVLGAATVYLSIPANEAQRKALVEQMAPDF